jgi:hypothetical protein
MYCLHIARLPASKTSSRVIYAWCELNPVLAAIFILVVDRVMAEAYPMLGPWHRLGLILVLGGVGHCLVPMV